MRYASRMMRACRIQCEDSVVDLVAFEFKVVTVDAEGKVCDRQPRSAFHYVEMLDEKLTLKLVAIPGGTQLMGAPKTEEGWLPTQAPQHLVTVPPFLLSQYPVTQAQWKAIASLPNVERPLHPEPSCIRGATRPVEQISWEEAVEFCARLSHHTGHTYRLPSEAEWEYACRAGTLTPFHFGETMTTELANYSGVNWDYMGRICSRGAYGAGPQGSDRRETTPVGQFQVANSFGLYDMHGNVREWCLDLWHETYDQAPADGTAWVIGGDPTQRVVRGGSWNTGPACCRSAFRTHFDGDGGLYDIGFRVAMSCQEHSNYSSAISSLG